MSASMIWPAVSGHSGLSFARGAKAFGTIPAIALLLCASLLVAMEAPSKPFLEKNAFYLRSAGFRAQFATDAAAKKAMNALPPHHFVVHRLAGGDRYLYAEPIYCVCVFIGTQDNYNDYRSIISQPIAQPLDVAPDYNSQMTSLLQDGPTGLDTVGDDTVANFYAQYY
jgi:hypothetical protein